MIRLLLLIFIAGTIHAQDQQYIAHYEKDLGLIIHHEIKAGQTVFGLTQHFGSDMETTLDLNANVNLNDLNLDENITLSIYPSLISHTPSSELAQSEVLYVVKPGQTLYSISRIYFDQDVTDIMRLNELNNYNIHPGDTLLMGFIESPFFDESHSIERFSDQIAVLEDIPLDTVTQHDTSQMIVTTEVRVKTKEKGLAYWQSIENSSEEFIVLHKSAPINQPITLYNPMMDRFVEATVVAPLPEKSYPDNISVVISPAVADALGALDKRFIVEMTY